MPARFPTFSPDGKRIAYEQQVGIQRDIVIMNADGTGRLNLTSANTTQDQFLSSPDGKRIAFERDVLGDEEIRHERRRQQRHQRLAGPASGETMPYFARRQADRVRQQPRGHQ